MKPVQLDDTDLLEIEHASDSENDAMDLLDENIILEDWDELDQSYLKDLLKKPTRKSIKRFSV